MEQEPSYKEAQAEAFKYCVGELDKEVTRKGVGQRPYSQRRHLAEQIIRSQRTLENGYVFYVGYDSGQLGVPEGFPIDQHFIFGMRVIANSLEMQQADAKDQR